MKLLDLFSGIGGFSYALHKKGIETLAFCEMDKHAQSVLKKNWADISIYDDVVKLTKEVLGDVKIDFMCGGFPCQDISIAGKQVGITGSRSGLWKEYLRLISDYRPKCVFIENVANLRAMGLSVVMKDLADIGYDMEWHIISCSAVGGIHRRERTWMLAYPASDVKKIHFSRHFYNKNGGNYTVWDKGIHNINIKDISATITDIPENFKKNKRVERITRLGNAIIPQIAEMMYDAYNYVGNVVLDTDIIEVHDLVNYNQLVKIKGRSGFSKKGKHYIIKPSVPFDDSRDCGLFPTVTCRDASLKKARLPSQMIRKDGRNVLRQPGLAEMFLQDADFPILKEMQINDDKTINAQHSIRKQENTNKYKKGILNPDWVDWFMGFPVGWTDISK